MAKGSLLFQESSIVISWLDLSISLCLAVILGTLVVGVYRITHRGFNYERSFLITLLMLPEIIALVIMLIGSNLALSLGMVGSLSIIRFRTVIKDSRDMVYLFFTLAIGLGCGTYNWKITIIAAVFIAATLYIFHLIKFGTRRHSEYALVIRGTRSLPEELLLEIINNHVASVQVRSIDVKENVWEIVYELRLFMNKKNQESDLLQEINKSIANIESISILAPQLSLPL